MHQKTQERATNSLQISQTVKKLVLSSAVAVTFAAYAVHERTNTDGTDNSGSVGLLNTAKPNEVSAMPPFEPTATRTVQPAGTTRNTAQNLQPTARPTQAPPTAAPSNGIKDGTYTGDSANAYYGNVQVAAVIQGNRLTQVQILDYPQHRNTSIRINRQALPYLQSEAIQAQSANVDIISGATLTSEAFAQSLQSALSRARG